MKNRRNIIEQKYPPENPNDLWMKDDILYKSTHEGWIPLTAGNGLSTNGVISTTWLKLKDKRDAGKLIPGALYRITDYNCTTTQENTQSAGHQFDIVLLALSENKLAEEGWAMEHPTDVYDVTFATGKTIKCYISETYYVDDSPHLNLVRCDTYKGRQIAPTDITAIDNVLKTATVTLPLFLLSMDVPYNYFQNSNLSAWKVWYCLDNDKSRFAWADDSVDEDSVTSITITIPSSQRQVTYTRNPESDVVVSDEQYYNWYNSEDEEDCYTLSEIPEIGDSTYEYSTDIMEEDLPITAITTHEGTGEELGRGVIYRLIDEFNNDIKYDFKNIQFKRKLTNGQYDATNGTDTWCYTLNIWYNDMCQDASIVGNTLSNDEGIINGVYDNKFGYATAYDLNIEGVNTFTFALGNNVVLSLTEGGAYYGINSNTIGNGFYSNTIGDLLYSNIIGNRFSSNIIGNGFRGNIIGHKFSSNMIGDEFNQNTIGNVFSSNTIGNNVYFNMIGNNFSSKTISDNTSYKNYGNNGVELATKS